MTGSKRVVVVGAGPAGLAAAASAARGGADAIVLDEQSELGGQLLYRAQPLEPAPGMPAARPRELADRLIAEAIEAGARLRPGTLVGGAFAGNELLIVGEGTSARLVADALIVATGSTDLPYPFAGATYPGVFSARALQSLINRWRVRPGQRFAIIGSGNEADELTVDCLLAGGEVAWSGIAPAPFLRVQGNQGVRSFMVGQDEFAVDSVGIAVGRQADAALATMAGVPLAFAAALGGLVPMVDDRLESPIPRLFVAGDAAGAGSVAVAIAEGHLAGAAAAASLGLATESDVAEAAAAGGPELAWRMRQRTTLGLVHSQPYR